MLQTKRRMGSHFPLNAKEFEGSKIKRAYVFDGGSIEEKEEEEEEEKQPQGRCHGTVLAYKWLDLIYGMTIFISNIHSESREQRDQLVLFQYIDLEQGRVRKSQRAEIYSQALISLRRSVRKSKELWNDHLHQQRPLGKVEVQKPTTAA